MSSANPPVEGTAVLVRSPSMSWQTIDGETVLLHLDGKNAELLGLNAVGARIWELLDGVRSIDAIVATIASEFEVSPATAATETRAFIAELIVAGGLVLRERGTG